MNVDKALISKLEKLSNLELDPKEKEQIQEDLTKMLGMVQKIAELDTEGVKPLSHMTSEINEWREDKVQNQLSREEALRNAPEEDGTYIKVPKVM